MKITRTAGLAALVVAAMTGCANLATFQNLSAYQQEALYQDLNDNYTDYRVHDCPGVLIAEPISDSRSIEVASEKCRTIDPLPAPYTPAIPKSGTFKSLLGNNNELYGYAYWNFRVYRVGARQLDESTLRAWYKRIEYGGP